MPKRVQMTRAKGGWRKDNPDAVIVARPSKWGNPYPHGTSDHPTRQLAVNNFAHDMQDWIDHRPNAVGRFLEPLRGKDLACWCPLDEPCHADVLLKMANVGEE